MMTGDYLIAMDAEKQSLKKILTDQGFNLTNIPFTQYHALFNLLNCDYYISPSGSDSNNGKTRTTPFLTLSKVISTATEGQNIGILPGVYSGTSNCNLSITKGLNIYGAPGAIFDGENTRRSGWTLGAKDATYTINVNDVTFQNASNPDYSSGGLFTWVNGNINHCKFLNNTAKYGGGMYNAGPAVLNNCIFDGNKSNAYGAGLYTHTSASGSINQCTFNNNIAIQFGGGIYNTGTGSLLNCILTNNIGGDAQSGGGIYTNGLINFTNCLIMGNKAGFGGGIYNNNTGVIQDCKIINNTAITKGGGIFSKKVDQITNTLFNNNNSEYGGGLYVLDASKINDCIFNNNSATSVGGGIYNNLTGVVTSCVFNHNISTYGAGISNEAEGVVNNCIFVSNIASNSHAIQNNKAASVIGCTFANNGDSTHNNYTVSNLSGGIIKNCDFLKLNAWNLYATGTVTVEGCYWMQSADGTPYKVTLQDGITATTNKTLPNFTDRLSNMQLFLSNTTEVVADGTKVTLTGQLHNLKQDPLLSYIDFYKDDVFIKSVLTSHYGTATLDYILPTSTTAIFDIRYGDEENLEQIVSNRISITTT